MREYSGENIDYKSETTKGKLNELREEINLTQFGEHIEEEKTEPDKEK